MDALRLYWPVKPHILTQGFGSNAEYYARFKDAFGKPEKGHNGLDFNAPHGTPVYAACDGSGFFVRDDHGGEGIYVTTALAFDYKGKPAQFNVIYWHLCGDTDPKYPSPFLLDGQRHTVKAGDLIGYADNTGAPFESTGDHLHFGLMPLDAYGRTLEPANGFGGCIDPTPYLTEYAAQDYPAAVGLYQQLLSVLSSLVSKLKGRSAPPAPSFS